MPKNLIIFGNGLGRALNPDFFNIEAAMTHAWENTDLKTAAKELIQGCLPEERGIPKSEDDLEDIYYAIISCVLLNYMARNCNQENHFLTQHGKDFLTNVRIFITEVASYFHTYEGEGLSNEFVQPLVQHIKETKSHVATLNYDALLYQCFIDNNVFGTYDSAYILDGMWGNAGFQKTNLDRFNGRDFGWYLHLHGSPLFRDKGGAIKKFSRAQLRKNIKSPVCNYSNHIVLSAVRHKKDYIQQSELLSAYWEYLDTAIDEAEGITVFGYSGADRHLNERIKSQRNGKAVRVVKRISNKTEDDERVFWNNIFGENVEVVRMENILRFTDW